jgi:lipase
VTADSTPASARIRVGDLTLRYLDFGGDGPPLVLLHATGFHAWIWAPYARRLRATHHALALDQRGHGESDKPPEGYQWTRFGEDLAGFLEALDLDRVSAVGHSKGATAIAAAAAAGSRRLARAVLIDPVLTFTPLREPASEHPLAVGALRRRQVWPSRQAMFTALRERMTFATWEAEFLHLYVDHGVADRPDGTVELLCPGQIESQIYANGPLLDAATILPALRVPTLLMRGAESPAFTGPEADRTLGHLTLGSLVAIPDTGHFLPMERSLAVGDQIARFIG